MKVSFRQDEIAALMSAITSYELELQDEFHDAEGPLRALEEYGEDAEITNDDIAEAEARLADMERKADALARARAKIRPHYQPERDTN